MESNKRNKAFHVCCVTLACLHALDHYMRPDSLMVPYMKKMITRRQITENFALHADNCQLSSLTSI